MTGEATLRARCCPSVSRRRSAAHRAGIKRVVLPERNRKDLPDIPEEIRSELEVHFCSRMEDVLDLALGADNIAAHREKVAQEIKEREAASKDDKT